MGPVAVAEWKGQGSECPDSGRGTGVALGGDCISRGRAITLLGAGGVRSRVACNSVQFHAIPHKLIIRHDLTSVRCMCSRKLHHAGLVTDSFCVYPFNLRPSSPRLPRKCSLSFHIVLRVCGRCPWTSCDSVPSAFIGAQPLNRLPSSLRSLPPPQNGDGTSFAPVDGLAGTQTVSTVCFAPSAYSDFKPVSSERIPRSIGVPASGIS